MRRSLHRAALLSIALSPALTSCGGSGVLVVSDDASPLVSGGSGPVSLTYPPLLPGMVGRRELVVRNVGASPLVLTSLEKVGGAASFGRELTGTIFEADFHPGEELGPGGFTRLEVSFFPSRVKEFRSDVAQAADLTLAASGVAGSGAVAIHLEGRVSPPACTQDTAVGFGPIVLENQDANPLVLINPLAMPANFTLEPLPGGVGQEAFSLEVSLPSTLTLGPLEERRMKVFFSPLFPGLHQARLLVHRPFPCQPAEVTLYGDALASFVEASPSSLDFGAVPVGSGTELTLRLTSLFNQRHVQLLDVAGDEGFSLVPGETEWDVPGYPGLKLPVRFTSTREGPAEGTLRLSLQDETAPLVVPLRATGVRP